MPTVLCSQLAIGKRYRHGNDLRSNLYLNLSRSYYTYILYSSTRLDEANTGGSKIIAVSQIDQLLLKNDSSGKGNIFSLT